MIVLPEPHTLLTTPKATLLAGVLIQPGAKAMETAARHIASLLTVPLAEHLAREIGSVVEVYELNEGDRPSDAEEAQPWDEGLDAAFEEALGPDSSRVYGVSAVGQHCIDSRIHEAAERYEKARALASAAAENAAVSDPVGFLKLFGVEEADLARKDVKPTPAAPLLSQGKVFEAIRKGLAGPWGDALTAIDEIETIGDETDDPLAFSSAQKLNYVETQEGMSLASLVATFRAMKKLFGDGWAEKIMKLAEANLKADEPVTPAAAAIIDEALGKAKPKGKGKKDKAAEVVVEAAPEPAIPPTLPSGQVETGDYLPDPLVEPKGFSPDFLVEALKLIKEHGATKEARLAEIIGVSRPTLNNVINGKTNMDFSEAQTEGIVQLIDSHIHGLLQARGMLIVT